VIILQQTRGVLFKPSGGVTNDYGDLVLEVLFEDGAGSATAVNTGTLGGTLAVGGATPASITTSDAFQGSGSLTFPNVINTQGSAAFPHPPELIISTANFRIQVAVKLTTFTVTFSQTFWGWELGTPQPQLAADTSGNLIFSNGSSHNTGQTIDLNVWNEYEVNRLDSVTTVLYNGVQVYQAADTNDYNNGFTNGSFRVGASGNGAASIRNGFLDQFRFYNANA
jgi:hypothetical protein